MANILYISAHFNDYLAKLCQQYSSKEMRICANVSQSEKSHIRCLNHYIKNDAKFSYITKEDDYISLDDWLQSQRQQNEKQAVQIDYWDILAQLLVGIYQIHKLGLIGRCIKYESIKVADGNLIYKKIGYIDSLEKAPENIFLQFTTYQTDVWLVGAIMWKVLTGQTIYNQQQNNDQNLIELTFNFNVNNQNLDEQLYQLLRKMLQIYSSQRITIDEICNHPRIQIPPNQKEEISKFYQNIKIKSLLKQRKNSFKRNYFPYLNDQNRQLQVYYYFIEDCPILNCYYQLYIQIQLLNLAFHISSFFPSQDAEVQTNIRGLILQKMILVSKQLKESLFYNKLPLQFLGQEEHFIREPYFNKIKEQVIQQQNRLDQIYSQFFQNLQLLTLQEIDKKLNTFPTNGKQTLYSRLVMNILKNSSVRERDIIYINSMSLEEMFEKEVKDRIE